MIDTHAHLYAPEFSEDLQHVIQRAKDQGMEEIWIPGTNAESLGQMDKLRELDPTFFHFFAGLHPEDVDENYQQKLHEIRQIVEAGHYTGIGEIGLDLYWDKTHVEEQKAALIAQLDWALERQQPVIIHVRDAFNEIMPIIRNYYGKGLRGIFHCFAGNQKQAEELSNNGFMLGVNGNITYKKNPVALFLKEIPLEHIVTETDAPYLAPVPHRGKRNESAHLHHVIQKLSEIYGLPAKVVERQTVLNAKRVLTE